MTAMTWEQAAAEIERMEAARDAERAAARAAITPHVLRPPRTQPGRMSGPRYFNLMRAIEADPVTYADYLPTTHCGAPRTTEDLDRRTVLAKKNRAHLAEWRVCPDCLTALGLSA